MGKTSFIYHPDCQLHLPGNNHPESPERLRVLIDSLISNELGNQLNWQKPEPAPSQWITKVHTVEYTAQVEKLSNSGNFRLNDDTGGNRHSYHAATLAAGAVLLAIDLVIGKDANNAFCAVRPPGHHARPDQGMGFCLFNNIAIGARYAQGKYNLKSILIVDWDAHHGNGTQEVFYADPTVFYFSLHEYPLYPGTGARNETGVGAGKKFTLNRPLPPRSGDPEFLESFTNFLFPAVSNFELDLILISAGFDAHRNDPLTTLKVTETGFSRATKMICDLAREKCSGRIVSVLEGGYDLTALKSSVRAHLEELLEA